MMPRLSEQGEDTRESPSQAIIGLVPTREATPEQHGFRSFHLSQDSLLLDRRESNDRLLSALSRGDTFDDPEEFTSPPDRPSSIPELVVTLCEAESNEDQQEDIDQDDSRLLLDIEGETERGSSVLRSALSGISHAFSPLSAGGSVVEEAAPLHRTRKGKERETGSEQAELASDNHLEDADYSDEDQIYDVEHSSDFAASPSGSGMVTGAASNALAMGTPGPSRLNRLPRRAGARNCEDLSALVENYGTSLEEQQRGLERFAALKHAKQQKERPATNKRRRQPDSDDEADDPTFHPSPGAQRKLRNSRVKRVKTSAGAEAGLDLPDVDEGSTSSRRRPSHEVEAKYHYDEPSDTSRPDSEKRRGGHNKRIDLDYSTHKRKQETPTFTPNKKMRTETDQEGFPCPTCGKVIGRNHDLIRHMRTHAGNKKPHPCPFNGCSKAFSRKDAVARHVAGKHKSKTKLRRRRIDENDDSEADEAQHAEGDVDDDELEEEEEVRRIQKSRSKSKKGGKRKRK